jgi:predicted metal-dependent hydrolase
MKPFQVEVKHGNEKLIVSVNPDSRLRRTVRWMLRGSEIQMRVPQSMNRSQIEKMIEDILPRIARQRKRARKQADVNLMTRAAEINAAYFGGELTWHTIRWVKNMDRRLGSFTTGGTTDGDIRISERIRRWPQYVIDYILAHEMCHRIFPNHSAEFWAYLSRYPHTEKAIGFVEGVAYAEGTDPDSLID